MLISWKGGMGDMFSENGLRIRGGIRGDPEICIREVCIRIVADGGAVHGLPRDWPCRPS